jgi:hypothetical protein
MEKVYIIVYLNLIDDYLIITNKRVIMKVCYMFALLVSKKQKFGYQADIDA